MPIEDIKLKQRDRKLMLKQPQHSAVMAGGDHSEKHAKQLASTAINMAKVTTDLLYA